MEENFLTQLAGEPTRGGVPGDALFANRGALMGGGIARGRLGHSDRDMIRFQFSVKGGRKEGGQQNHYLGLLEDRLWSVQDAGRENPLGGSPEGPRKAGHSSGRRSYRQSRSPSQSAVSQFREGWPG